MTIIESILEVMREAGHPLTVREVYERIVDSNLYLFKAQDPQPVVRSQIRRHCKGLEFPSAANRKYFKLEADGRFSPLAEPIRTGTTGRRNRFSSQKTQLPKSSNRSLSSTFEEIRSLQALYRQLLKDRVLKDLKNLTPGAFEHFSKKLLEVYGFEDMEVTSINNDGGIDGFGKLKVGLAHMRVAFQCKRWTKSNIGRPEIDRFRGAIQGSYEQGIFFTTANFVPAAMEASIRPGAVPIMLIDGPSIVDLMIDRQFGVQAENIAIHPYALDTILEDDNHNEES